MPDLTGEAENTLAAKIALRNRLLTARRSADPSAAALVRQTLDWVRRSGASTLAAYAPVGTEPGGSSLVADLAAHVRVLLPVLLPSNDLDWVWFTGSVEPGPRGLRQPPGPPVGVDAIASVDLILVPALAVDRAGNRLGRGGGSYDRALSRLPATGAPMVVALLHDGELLDRVPAEPHDRPVDGAITPSGGLTLSRGVEWTK